MGAKESSLNPTDLKEIADHTDFTEGEVQVWYQTFSKDCPSGKLTSDEFQNLYKNFFPDGDASAFAKQAFRTFDNNDDGTIDFREFLTALSVMSRGTYESKLAWSFSMYDKDSDGFVTKQEMLDIISAIYKMVGAKALSSQVTDGLSAEQRVNRIFSCMDKDGDQKITLAEFTKAASEDPSLIAMLEVNKGS